MNDWCCEICGTKDKRKRVIQYPPRCWDCIDKPPKQQIFAPLLSTARECRSYIRAIRSL